MDGNLVSPTPTLNPMQHSAEIRRTLCMTVGMQWCIDTGKDCVALMYQHSRPLCWVEMTTKHHPFIEDIDILGSAQQCGYGPNKHINESACKAAQYCGRDPR